VDERDLDPDPLATVAAWYAEAAAAGAPQPDAASLATATADGRPAARMVLVRGVEAHDFVFFTSREGRKSAELAANPRAALVLYWHELRRQVRLEGPVQELARAEVETYWRTRPRGSKLAARASRQSHPTPSREALEAAFADADERYPGDDVPLPDTWGGYRLAPEVVELWEHRANRLHDRVRYERDRNGWQSTRLMP
jgi:pyridoxamine 5'-phosphate oxidase